MDTPGNPPGPNQIRIRAVFVPDGQSVPGDLPDGMMGRVRIPVELVVDSDPEGLDTEE